MQSLHDNEKLDTADRVPESYYWLIVDGEYAGRVSVRHKLNDALRKHGGHMGYEIRPSLQQRGYGKLIARLGAEKARALGIRRALITCNDDNTASAKIIESLGGVLEDKIQLEEFTVLTRRYWVEL